MACFGLLTHIREVFSLCICVTEFHRVSAPAYFGKRGMTLHVLVSSLRGHSSTLDIVFHLNACYTRHYSFMYIYHYYTDTDTPDTIISCVVSLLHGYSSYSVSTSVTRIL